MIGDLALAAALLAAGCGGGRDSGAVTAPNERAPVGSSAAVSAASGNAGTEGRRPAAGPAGPAFIDVTARAGVGHLHHKPQFEAKVENIEPWLASVGAAAAAEDYDNDGWVDLYVTDSRKGFPNVLYHNNGDGTFTDVAAKAGVDDVNLEDGVSMDVVWGDYDNDGFDDLYVVKWGKNLLFHNNRDGTFTDVTDKAGVGDRGNGNAAIWFDYDGDGRLDLYVGNYFRKVDLWRLPTTRIMHDDFEKARDGGANVLYHNNGDGTFTDVSERAGVADTGWTLDVGASDYDNDGDLDLYVANDFGPDKLYRNDGHGTFTDVSLRSIGVDTRKGMNVEWGDFNNDGWPDIYVTNIMTAEYLKEGNMLFRNNGDGTFVDVAPEAGVADGGWGWAAKLFDDDNDGDLDIYTANGFISQGPGEEYWYDLATTVAEPDFDPVDTRSWPPIGNKSLSGHEPNRFFENEGGETFQEKAAEVGLADRRDGRGIALIDFDNDGDLDVFLVNQGERAALYRNDAGSRGNWVAFKLVGRGDAICARVTVTAGDLRQIRDVDPGNGFASQSDRRLFFGLGPRDHIDRVDVRWPGGKTQTLTDVGIRAFHTLKEP